MVRSSRLAHDGSTLLSWLAGPGSSRAPAWCSYVLDGCTAAGGTVPDRRRADPGRVAPAGTPSAARRGEALRDGVQPRTTPGEPPPRVRDEHPVHRDDPQQIVGRCPGSTPDTGPDRSLVGARPNGEACRRAGLRPGRRTGFKCTASPRQRGSAPGVRAAPAAAPRRAGPASPPPRRAMRGRPGDPRVGVAADVDAPPGEPRGEPGVLPLLADGERELEVRHDHPRRAGARVEHASPRPPSTARGRCRRTSRGRPTSR